jgi:hypothetical protein
MEPQKRLEEQSIITTKTMDLFVALLILLANASNFVATLQSPGDNQQRRTSSRSPRVGVTTDGLHCSRFEWNPDSISNEAVMRVPISLDGKMYWYQLDTGADVVGGARLWVTARS